MDKDGLKESIVRMLGGESCVIDSDAFQNDLVNIAQKDDVLTLLVHLGYLAYDEENESVSIPNEEIRREFMRALKNSSRKGTEKIIRNSDKLLKDTLNMNNEAVAKAIQKAHSSGTTPLFYNNEQALRSIIRLAYICCADDYVRFEELPSGVGYADIAFLPKMNPSLPIIVVELKWNDSAESAIDQIKNNNYPEVFEEFDNEILLVGINYDKDNKVHTCKIEKHKK